MKKVKAQRQKNSLVISLPDELSIEPDQEFFISKDEMGFITLVPLVSDIYAAAKSPDLADITIF
ncbi:type II toxin-antitoxin system PemI/MazE family antitoxin [Xylocopilactobacillus apicola]|uniref:AbrB family transcriptional regulator n=1 Tax=Xylocopilactobacillus apicola TaxID=2932184 RepID=A0AAU9DE36_9LACO|nr:AbrB family transcriptional regulator [Xylocopilactobacillus apicola]BDR59117.1 hypothetical protein XA3_15580 [Xylocopilactobacillus apicola]